MRKYLIILCLYLIGCGVPKVSTLNQFHESEVESYKQQGNAVVKGQLFSRTNSGDVKSGAGKEVYLIPNTPYFNERNQILKECKQPENEIDSTAKSFVKTDIVDLQGNFEFSNIPAGKYLVTSQLYWTIPSGGPYGGVQMTGSFKVAEIAVTDDEILEVAFMDYCSR